MRKTLRTILVSVLVFSLSVDSASACRFFCRYWSCYRPCAPVCYRPCYAPVVCYQPCDPCWTSCTSGSEAEPAAPTEEPLTAPESSSPSAPEPATVNKPAEPELPPVMMPQPMPGEGEPAATTTDQQDEWRPANETPPPAAEPAPPADELFGETPESEPAPAVTPPQEPSDLFGPSSEEQPSQPAETGNDLFGPSSEQPAGSDEGTAPAEQPPANDSSEPSAPAAPANNDLFGPTSDESSTPAEEDTDKALDNPDEQPPAEEAAPAEEKEENADDLFGGVEAVLQEPGGLASAAMRQWIDNTGRFSCRGRLMEFQDGHVRLLKDNGRTTTVPLYRLSQGDLQFVYRQASAQRADVFGQTASADAPQTAN